MECDQTGGTGGINRHTRSVQVEEVRESVGHDRHGVARQLVHRNVLRVFAHIGLIVSGRKVAHETRGVTSDQVFHTNAS